MKATRSLAVSARSGAVTMIAVLASWETALRLSHRAALGDDVIVLAVVMALLTAQAGQRQAVRWWLRLLVLPVAVVAAMLVGRLMAREAGVGDAVFVLALSGGVWLRRFGPTGSAIGTLVALPFVSLLVVPVPIAAGARPSLWPVVVSVIALVWVALAQYAGRRIGWVATPFTTGSPSPRRLAASTRMAAQLAVGLAAAFVAGRLLYPDHWAWCVLSCYVVCSGNRGRGDVVHKGVARLSGALAGTVVATLVAGAFPPGDATAIVLLFAVMAGAVVLRPMGYGYWAAGVTAMLALLYGYYGQSGTDVLRDRLGGVLLGCLAGVAASWWVLPVRSNDVFRRRWATALAAVSDVLADLRADPPDRAAVASSSSRLRRAVVELEQLEPSYRLHRRVSRRRSGVAHPVDLVVALRELDLALDEVVALLATADVTPEDRRRIGAWSRRVGVVRRRMRTGGSAPEDTAVPLGALGAGPLDRADRAVAALDELFVDEVWHRLGGRPSVSDNPHTAAVTNR